MNISDRIYQLRKEKGLSQEEFANGLGVSRQSVSKWESEQCIPEMEKVILIAEYFNVTTDYLLNGKEPELKKAINWCVVLPKIATCFNFIALTILIFDMFLTWNTESNFMSNIMIITKVVIVLLMIVGSTLFFLSEEKITYKKARKYLMINVIAYSGLISMLVYLFIIPGVFWPIVAYIIVIFISEVFLIKIKPRK